MMESLIGMIQYKLPLVFCTILISVIGFSVADSGCNVDSLIHGKEALLNGDYNESITWFEKTLTLCPDNSTALNNQGIAFLRLGNCHKAADLFEKASNDKAVHQQALINLAMSLECQGQNQEAEGIYNTLIQENTSDTSALYRRGLLFYEREDWESALKDFQSGLQVNPHDIDLLRSYGVTLGSLGRNEDGLQVFNQILQMYPGDELSLYNKAVILEKTGRFKDAVDAYNDTIRINPENKQAWFNRGNIFWSHYILNESLQSFDSVISLDPNMSQAWYFRGLVLKQLGMVEDAADSFKRAIELEPHDSIYQAYYRKYKNIASQADGIQDKTLSLEYRSLLAIFPVIIIIGSWLIGLIYLLSRRRDVK